MGHPRRPQALPAQCPLPRRPPRTAVPHPGSLVFHASLCKVTAVDRVIGIQLALWPHNQESIQAHPLSSCWAADNPYAVAQAFLTAQPEFVAEPPTLQFDESAGSGDAVPHRPGPRIQWQ